MLTPPGYAQVFFEGKVVLEFDTYTCKHCGRISFIKPRESPYATCKSCMGFICEGCYHDLTVGTGICTVLEKRLRIMEGEINAAILRGNRLQEYEFHSARLGPAPWLRAQVSAASGGLAT